MAERIRIEEHEVAKEQQEDRQTKHVFDRCIRCEPDRVLFVLHVNPSWVVLTRHVQRPNMKRHNPCNQEGDKIVKGEKAIKRWVINGEPTPKPFPQRIADERDRTEQVGDNRGTPEAHLSPRKHVAHKASSHHQEVDQHTQDPKHLTRRLVGTVIKAPKHVNVDGEEEHGGAVRMHIANEPAIVHIAHNVLNAVKRHAHMRRVVHCEHDACHDLDHETECQDCPERPPIVQIARRRIDDKGVIPQTHDRKTIIHPFGKAI
mmetsp:Transcript_29895/g.39746  ORF Transcript_29895/g.39746 Transcript_29895/m.39746 type:complete len:260 (+) Transcript_29895:591-1370(+)